MVKHQNVLPGPWRYNYCYLNRIIDGDTFEVTVDLGFDIIASITIRLKGVDVEEANDNYEVNKQAMEVAENFMGNGKEYFAIEVHEKGSFGRWIADVFHKYEDETLLNEYLVLNDLAEEVDY